MVHALREIGRTLRPGGLLVDPRPLSKVVQVQIETSPGPWVAVGELDESHYVPDDLAADRATAQAVREGWLRPAGSHPFDFRWHFDDLDELAEYAGEEWEDRLDEATLTLAAERLAALPPGAGLCVRRQMRFAIYRTVDEANLEAVSRGQAPPTLRFLAWEPACLSPGYARPFAEPEELLRCCPVRGMIFAAASM